MIAVCHMETLKRELQVSITSDYWQCLTECVPIIFITLQVCTTTVVQIPKRCKRQKQVKLITRNLVLFLSSNPAPVLSCAVLRRAQFCHAYTESYAQRWKVNPFSPLSVSYHDK